MFRDNLTWVILISVLKSQLSLFQQQTEMYKVSHLAEHMVVFALRMF